MIDWNENVDASGPSIPEPVNVKPWKATLPNLTSWEIDPLSGCWKEVLKTRDPELDSLVFLTAVWSTYSLIPN